MVMFDVVQVDRDFRINIGCRFMYSVQRSHSHWTKIAQYTYLCERILLLYLQCPDHQTHNIFRLAVTRKSYRKMRPFTMSIT